LSGVKFADGGAATGSFIYDAATGAVLDFDFHFEGSLNGFPYVEANQSYPCQPNNVLFPGERCWVAQGLFFGNGATSPSGAAFVQLVPERALTANGGVVALTLGGHDDPDCPYCLTGSGVGWDYSLTHFFVIAGELTGAVIPEPSRTIALILGLVTLVCFSRVLRAQMATSGTK
jgi:hypothetical protein